jgi:hypothetical protein
MKSLLKKNPTIESNQIISINYFSFHSKVESQQKLSRDAMLPRKFHILALWKVGVGSIIFARQFLRPPSIC